MISAAQSQQDLSQFFNRTTAFFRTYAHNGLVSYGEIKKDSKQIRELVGLVENFDVRKLSDANYEKAFWINAYNILVINSVVENSPIASPMDVAGFFDRRKHQVAGEKLTLNDIENIKLREKFRDARIHFALVCAALSCPPIINQAYLPETLDEQLDQRTRANLNDDNFIRVDKDEKKVYLSEIFKWYKEDFGNFLQFVNQYRTQTIPEDYAIDYYTYDWRLNESTEARTGQLLIESDNLQAYTPSTLLRPGEVEVKTFNNLYTQTAFYNADGDKVDLNTRSTFFTNITSFLIGAIPNINVGFDVYFKSVRNAGEASSPLSVFRFSSGNNSRTALTSFAPKIKVSPFSGLRNLSLQTLVLIPLTSDLDENPFLDHGAVQWWTQLFYDKMLSSKFLIYLENGWLLRFDSKKTIVTSPLKVIGNYYPSGKWTVYLPTELTPTWDRSSWSSYFFQAGLGLKYQLTANLEVETLATKFFKGKDAGAGVTYNIGFRIIR